MFAIFTAFADWLVYGVLSLNPHSRLGEALHFFVEDTVKIFVLLLLMIYVIALLRASLNVEKVRDYLAGKNRVTGYLLGSAFGAVTPFCSCSSIPAFLGFTSAGIPVGITMAFLITSPLINEVAVLLLVGLLGWQFTVVYVLVGMLVGIVSGAFLDAIHAERWLQSFAAKALQRGQQQTSCGANSQIPQRLGWQQRHDFAAAETKEIVGRVWKWVFIGVGLGAALHGFVPDGWVENHLGQGQWWSVPLAVLIGVPLYSNVTGIVPVMESLLQNGLPVGTTLAFCMATVAASFPEFVLLKQVMQWRLLASVFGILLLAFTLIGWLFNLIGPVL
ncbi:permease [Shewanella yunxiaonensis]|uniref:Permease n=1 Tax=Shewanella yunxiaonensis TaxID=2829809 RepID=A0ABX7YU20_9GAMM|nr:MULTISPECIES: permease [Shewanella]MDF0534718.1 permease [Shewanella sp. A32]QUN06270.1 permease [Shewanella yunxiaonensis]